MLPKKSRVDKSEVEKIFKKGLFVPSSSLTFKFVLTGNSHSPKISFIVPKTVSKGAVRRNLLRRRGYSALAKVYPPYPRGLLGVFIFKKYQEEVLVLENEIKNIFSKVH